MKLRKSSTGVSAERDGWIRPAPERQGNKTGVLEVPDVKSWRWESRLRWGISISPSTWTFTWDKNVGTFTATETESWPKYSNIPYKLIEISIIRVATLLGTPARLGFHAVVWAVKHVGAEHCAKSCGCGSKALVNDNIKHQTWGKWDPSEAWIICRSWLSYGFLWKR